MGLGMDNRCVNRVINGAAIGGALGASIGKCMLYLYMLDLPLSVRSLLSDNQAVT